MILTVTLNPAVDKTYTAGELIAGHVNRMRTVMSIAGGKGINVARVLRQYGHSVYAAGFLGGYTGDFIEDQLNREGIGCRFVRVEGDTRVNMNIISDNGYVTEILEPGPEISGEDLNRFFAGYDELMEECGLVVLSGSLAVGAPDDIYATLISKASDRGVRVILDTSGEALRKGIEAGPYMIKPNQRELEYIVGHKLVNRETVAHAALSIHEKGVEHVVVSMGKKGLLSVSGNKVYFAKAGKVEALNTVSCGDSVVASYAMSMLEGVSDEQALVRAAAISAANATTLKNADIPKEIVEELEKTMTVEVLI